jgi:hypothetical protein
MHWQEKLNFDGNLQHNAVIFFFLSFIPLWGRVLPQVAYIQAETPSR